MTSGTFDLTAFDKDGIEWSDYNDYVEGSLDDALLRARLTTYIVSNRVHSVEVRHRKSGLLMAMVTHKGVTKVRE